MRKKKKFKKMYKQCVKKNGLKRDKKENIGSTYVKRDELDRKRARKCSRENK